MAEPNGRSFWLKFVAALLVPLALGLIGFGALKNDVARTREEMDTKASKETVQTEYEALLREMQAMRADLADIKRNCIRTRC